MAPPSAQEKLYTIHDIYNDATFMRMKEDVMGNGQLKPAYNRLWRGIYPSRLAKRLYQCPVCFQTFK